MIKFHDVLPAVAAVLVPLSAVSADFGKGYRREVSEAVTPVPREKAAGRTWFVTERQPYLPHMNFMHYWIDRPLFTDVSLRRAAEGAGMAGFYRDTGILKWSGFDAFGSVAYPSIFAAQMRWLKERPVEGYAQFPILCNFYRPIAKNPANYEVLKKMIRDATDCPSALRFGGKVFTWTWGNSIDHQREWLKTMKSDPSVPPFVSMPISPFFPLYKEFVEAEKEGREPSREAVEGYKESIARLLEWSDGMQVRLHEYFRPHDGEYAAHHLKHKLCEKYIFPMTREVIERPEYRGRKFLGAYIEQCYINHSNGHTTGQYGTETLRTYLDQAGILNLDFLCGFEWNEANENTHFQPMLSSAGTVARVINYYRAAYEGLGPTPRPGDDTSVPNLVLSVRRSMRVGESYHVEMLFIPDGTSPEPFEARVALKDPGGATVCELPWEKLPLPKLTAFSYNLPSERFADLAAVQAVIETRTGRGGTVSWEGFDSTRFNPTWCTDYLYTRQPLREIMRPAKAEFSARADGKGGYEISGSFSGADKLASLEVVDGQEEVRAVDREKEFDRGRYELFRGSFHMIKSIGNAKGFIDVVGSRDWKIRASGNAWEQTILGKRRKEDGKCPARINLCSRRVFLLAVPKADVAKAVLDMDLTCLTRRKFALKDICDRGYYAYTWPNQTRLELERMDDLPDYPVHVDATSARIEANVVSKNRHPVFQLRAVSKEGKVWRSKVIVPSPARGDERTVKVHSEYAKRTVPVRMKADAIPDIVYDFADDSHGDWLVAKMSDRRWNAQMGGGWTGGGAIWWEAAKQRLTGAFSNSVPCRVTADGRPALYFDGSGQYLSLPQETLPCSSGYRLAFEIKPDDTSERVLLRMATDYTAEINLRLVIKDGALMMSHWGRALVVQHYSTGLKLKPGEWNSVVVEKTPLELSCTLNGKTKTYRYTRRGRYFSSAAFGGNTMPGDRLSKDLKPFKGYLRALSVRHGSPCGERE